MCSKLLQAIDAPASQDLHLIARPGFVMSAAIITLASSLRIAEAY